MIDYRKGGGIRTRRKAERSGLLGIGLTALVFVVVVLAACSVFITNISRDSKSSVISELENYADTAQLTLDMRLNGDFSTLDGIAQCITEMQDVAPSVIEKLLDKINRSNDFIRMGCAGPDGSACMYDVNGQVYKEDFSGEPFFKAALGGRNAIQDTIKDKHSDIWIVRYAVPIRDEDGVTGALVAVHSSAVFSKVVSLNEWSGFGYANIINGNGDLIIRSRSPMLPSDALSMSDLGVFSDDEREALGNAIASEGGMLDYTAHDGRKMTAVIRPLGVNNWHLACSLSEDYISAPFVNNAWLMIAVLACSLVLFMVPIFISMRMIMRGQRELRMQSEENAAVIEQTGKTLLRYDTATKTVCNLSGTHETFGMPPVMANYPEAILDTGMVMPESVEDVRRFYADMRNGVLSGGINARFRLADGTIRWCHADYVLLPDENGHMTRSIVSFYDNTELREKELAYELRRNELRTLKDTCIYYMEVNLVTGHIEDTYGNAVNFSRYTGSTRLLYSIIEWDAQNNIYPDDAKDYIELFDKNRLMSLYAQGVYGDSLDFRAFLGGALKWNRVTLQMARDPYTEDIKLYAVFNDITEERAEREQLLDMAASDSLTGLLNREATMSAIEEYLQGEGEKGTHALYMIDIDDFKQINDAMGHLAGDGVLKELTAAIKRCFRKIDILGRIGGDEFFAFMKNVESAQAARDKARELVDELQYVYADHGRRIDLTASVGAAIYSGGDTPPKPLNRLYAEADAALYKAKAVSRERYAFSDERDVAEKASRNADSGSVQALSLSDLINNLGGGVEIYCKERNKPLVPKFCNESFLKLIGGMTEREFLDIYGDNAFDGIYPDDLPELMEVYEAALREGGQYQHTHRMRAKGGVYRWVTVTANFVKRDDESYDLYAIYADAEHLVRARDSLEAQYGAFRRSRGATRDDAIASYHLNLTRNTYTGVESLLCIPFDHTADEFFDNVRARLDDGDKVGALGPIYSRETFISRFRRGEASHRAELPFALDDSSLKWMRLTMEIAENPDTFDIEALVRIYDIDREKRLNFLMNHLVGTDYEFLGQLDVSTGRLIVFGGNMDIEKTLMQGDAVDYDMYVPIAMRGMIRDDYRDEAIEAVSHKRITAELDKIDSYVCTYPTKPYGSVCGGYRQWHFRYLDSDRRVIVISRTDVTDTISGETDALTGLYNHLGFYRHVRETLRAHPDKRFRIHRFDVDSFKLLNDTLGYAKGDKLLRDFGTMLRRRAAKESESVIFARLETDHFVSLRAEDSCDAETLMRGLVEWMEAYELDFSLTGHMGVYHIEDTSMDVSAMCDRALLALKSVKQSFSKRVGYYDESLRDKLMQEQALVAEMESALSGGQFEAYFQPQYNYEDGSLIGAETLVRWNHPTRGLIVPGVFIPLFERNGFITLLDEYIWEQSCRYVRKWMDAPDEYASVPVSVNISRMDIYNPRLCDILVSLVNKYDIPPQMLKLEITESAYMQNPEQLIYAVNELRGHGFIIEMDDFGAGYSSLNTLKNVPVDVLKLDMKFMAREDDDERGGNILASIIRMAHWLKIPVIAEGVEHKAQADYLKSLGCYYMQGYYFARPMPACMFEAMLKTARTGGSDLYADTDLNGVAAFWNASAQTALLFNSFVGGAAILEYRLGNAEIVRANDKFFEQLETTREQYMSKLLHTLDRFEGEHRRAFEGMLAEAVRTGREAECEVQSKEHGKNGSRFWTHNRVRLLAKNVDSCLFYLATENITARKTTEEHLKVSREALRLTISQTGRAVCDYDISTHELTMPEAFASKYGMPPRVRDIQLMDTHVIPEDVPKFQDFYDRIHNGEDSASALVRICEREDGCGYTWTQMDAVTIFGDDGRPWRAIITCEDVTEQKTREAESVRNNLIIENTGICVFDYDVATDTAAYNTSIKGKGGTRVDIVGYTAGLQSDDSVVHPDDRSGILELITKVTAGKPSTGTYEYRADIWGTGLHWCRMIYASIGDENGKVYRIVGHVSDIQKERDDEALIMKLNEELQLDDTCYRYNSMLAERVFTMLYGANAAASAIDRVLAVLGQHYGLSRTYIIEQNEDGKSCSNTFEWCAPDATREIDNLQNLSYEDDLGGSMFSEFDSNGVLICRDISALPKKQHDIAERQGILSMLQCAINDGGTPFGCIAFDDCREHRDWTEEQIGTLMLVSRIVGSFLIRLRKSERAVFSEDFKSALDDDGCFIYIINPSTCEVKYCNNEIKSFFGGSIEGRKCHEAFADRDTPCDTCPIRKRGETGRPCAVAVRRRDGATMAAQASPLR